MKIGMLKTVDVDVVTVELNAKIRDEGIYTFVDYDGDTVKVLEGEYVPRFFPGQHYGDYLELTIDLETGKILNWDPELVRRHLPSILNPDHDQ